MGGRVSRVGSCSQLQRARARWSASVIGARPGLRDIIPRSQSPVEDLSLIRVESVSEASCRDEYHTVCESDRSSKDGSQLTPVVAHDVNCLMTGDSQRGNLTLETLHGMRLREGKRENMNERSKESEDE